MDAEKDRFRLALQHLKAAHGRTAEEMAKASDCSVRHIQGVLSDKERKGVSRAAGYRLAGFFGMTYQEMLDLGQKIESGESVEITRSTSNVGPAHGRREANMVPLISWVQAGEFVDPQAQTTPGFAEEYIDTISTRSSSAFALTIKGDSMAPEFTEGDIIVVDPDRYPVSGNYIIAKNGTTEVTFKQYVVDGSSVFLKPLNDRYPIKDMTGVEFRIVGVVVEKRKRYF